MKIYAVRHSITPLNKQRLLNAQIDESLAPEGIDHAQKAISLFPKTIKHIYSSSLNRAKETAEIINSKAGLPISTHDELREVHMGSLAGKSWEDVDAMEPEIKIRHYALEYDYQSFGGESVKQVKTRLKKILEQINQNHNDHEALIVTHGGILRLLYKLGSNEKKKDIEHVSFQEFDLDKILAALI